MGGGAPLPAHVDSMSRLHAHLPNCSYGSADLDKQIRDGMCARALTTCGAINHMRYHLPHALQKCRKRQPGNHQLRDERAARGDLQI